MTNTGTSVCRVEPVGDAGPVKASCVKDIRVSLPGRSKIGLLEHCGTGNLGDDATVATVLQQIKSRWPTASIVGLSLDPVDSERRHQIPCFAIRQSVFPFEQEWSSPSPAVDGVYSERLKTRLRRIGPLYRAAKAIKKVMVVRPWQFAREIVFLGQSLFLACDLDLLVICGGGQLLDWGGPWAFPYTLFKWCLLARGVRAKCIFLNNGAGPLDATLSRWFVKRALAMANYVSLRDRASEEVLRKVGFRGKVKVVADSAWGLRLPEGIARRKSESKGELVIGIAPMAYGDSSRHWVDDNRTYRNLIDSLAEFSGELLRRGHRIKLFSSDIWFDSQAIADLEATIRKNNPTLAGDRVTREPVADIDELLEALARVDCYVTCRFHGIVFASLLNVPTIALAPHPKVTTLMGDMGLSEYCMDIATCDATGLTIRFDRLLGNMDDVKVRILRHVTQFQSRLASQFDCLFRASPEIHTEDQHDQHDQHLISVRSVT
jgi:polysaccharide pyruvyl transferase WcaK-like protein